MEKLRLFLRKILNLLVKMTSKENFLLVFPLAIFAYGMLAYCSFIMCLAFLLWLVPVINALRGEKEDTI